MQFLNDYNLLYQKQFGFQKNISTAYAVIKHTKDIEKSLGNKQSDNNLNACIFTKKSHSQLASSLEWR